MPGHGLQTAQRSFSPAIGMKAVCSESKPREENRSLSRPGDSSATFRRFPVKVIGLFTANRPMTRTSGDSICRQRSNGRPSALTRLISSSRREDTPNFSPDGKRIVFSSNRSGHWEIWVCDSDGQNSVQLTSFGGSYVTGTPRWSPDGKTIVFDSVTRGKPDIFVINAESRVQRNLTANSYLDAVPSWSRDGRWIYFSSDRGGDGGLQVWKMPVEVGQPIQVTKKGGLEAFESFDGTDCLLLED